MMELFLFKNPNFYYRTWNSLQRIIITSNPPPTSSKHGNFKNDKANPSNFNKNGNRKPESWKERETWIIQKSNQARRLPESWTTGGKEAKIRNNDEEEEEFYLGVGCSWLWSSNQNQLVFWGETRNLQAIFVLLKADDRERQADVLKKESFGSKCSTTWMIQPLIRVNCKWFSHQFWHKKDTTVNHV